MKDMASIFSISSTTTTMLDNEVNIDFFGDENYLRFLSKNGCVFSNPFSLLKLELSFDI
jgi:hypothetical protein